MVQSEIWGGAGGGGRGRGRGAGGARKSHPKSTLVSPKLHEADTAFIRAAYSLFSSPVFCAHYHYRKG